MSREGSSDVLLGLVIEGLRKEVLLLYYCFGRQRLAAQEHTQGIVFLNVTTRAPTWTGSEVGAYTYDNGIVNVRGIGIFVHGLITVSIAT